MFLYNYRRYCCPSCCKMSAYRTAAGDPFNQNLLVRLVPQWECGMGRKTCWQQKGTGRARHEMHQGAHISYLFGVNLFSLDGLQMSSAIIYWGQQFRDGATMHGPNPQSHAFELQEGSPARPLDCNFSSCSRREGKYSRPV